jgi:hypothetical protein
MHRRTLNRMLIVFGMVYVPIAALGATGSYRQMAGVFVALALMAWLGYRERDYRDRD